MGGFAEQRGPCEGTSLLGSLLKVEVFCESVLH